MQFYQRAAPQVLEIKVAPVAMGLMANNYGGGPCGTYWRHSVTFF